MNLRIPGKPLLLLSAILFILWYVIAGYFNRPAHDDFDFLYQVRESDPINATQYYYQTWNTRWVAIFFANLFYKLYLIQKTFITFHIVTLILIITSLGMLISAFLKRIQISFNFSTLFTITVLIFSSVFFSTFSIEDAYYWVNTTTMYSWNIAMFLIFASVVIDPNKNLSSFIIAVFTGFIIGGSSEPFCIMLIVTISAFIMVTLSVSNKINKVTLMFLIAMLCSFAISYLGPGHVQRSQFLPDTGIFLKAFVLVKSMIKLFIIELPSKLPYAILSGLLGYLIGTQTQEGSLHILNKSKFADSFIKLSILFIALCLISLAPIAYLMSEMGPPRALTHIAWLFVVYIFLNMFIYGYKREGNSQFLIPLSRFYPWIVATFILVTGLGAIKKAYDYSAAYDERMQLIEQEVSNGRQETLVITKSLPDPGWLHSAELTPYPSSFINSQMQKYLNTDFSMIIEKEAKK